MAYKAKPTLRLMMDLDESVYTEEIERSIKRTYSYVAPTFVSSHPCEEGKTPENRIKFVITYYQPYWDKNDAAQEENWQMIIPQWIHNMFYKNSQTMMNYNKNAASDGFPSLEFDWLEFDFVNHCNIAVHLPISCEIPEVAYDFINNARDYIARGYFGEKPVTAISIPAPESYEEQKKEAAEAIIEEFEEQERLAAEAAAAEAEAAALAAAEAGEENLEADDAEAIEELEDEQTTEEVDDAEEAEEPEEPEEPEIDEKELLSSRPDFEIDYSCWQVTYEDGSKQNWIFES